MIIFQSSGSKGSVIYNSVMSQSLDMTTSTLTLQVGSWYSLAESTYLQPYKITLIKVKYTKWMPSYLDDVVAIVQQHPDWSGLGSQRPNSYSVLCLPERSWIDPRSLPESKTLRSFYVNTSRQQANLSTFVFSGKSISVDNLGRSDIDGVLGIVALTNEMPKGWKGLWKAVDNTYVSIPDVATWKLFYAAMVAQGSANFYHAQDLKSQIEKATTIAEVEAIVW